MGSSDVTLVDSGTPGGTHAEIALATGEYVLGGKPPSPIEHTFIHEVRDLLAAVEESAVASSVLTRVGIEASGGG